MIEPFPQRHPMLYQTIDKFDFANPPTDPIQLAKDLAHQLIAHNGLGLAANQIGLPYRAFAIKAEQVIVAFNPLIVDSSEETVYLEEGCLSFQGLIMNIKRPAVIKVRYTEPNGNVVTTKFAGLTARVFQHELDHLNGVTFHKRASRLQRERGLQKQKKHQRRANNG